MMDQQSFVTARCQIVRCIEEIFYENTTDRTLFTLLNFQPAAVLLQDFFFNKTKRYQKTMKGRDR